MKTLIGRCNRQSMWAEAKGQDLQIKSAEVLSQAEKDRPSHQPKLATC
jgi:hypothetical protein